MPDKITLDTTIVIYAFGRPDDVRKRIAKEIITKCNVISLQVLNETIFVLLKKFKLPLEEIEKVAEFMKQKFVITNLNIHTLDLTITILNKYMAFLFGIV